MAILKNRIVKTDFIEWQKLKWFQPENLKKATGEQLKRLKTSLLKNGFALPFTVWQEKRNLWILDGHFREQAMQSLQAEGVNIPPKLPAVFIKCKDRKEAKKFVLVYNSRYAEIQQDSLTDFITDLNLDDLLQEIELSDINLNELLNPVIEEERPSLRERFGIPPFTILDARHKLWMDRKKIWIALGLQSELGRGATNG